MRCYHFQNMYLSGIHAGIQTAHTQHELAMRYRPGHSSPELIKKYTNWAQNYKTIVVLNGGMANKLSDLELFLESPENTYPWASFHESEEALNGCITNIGIVLPESFYNYHQFVGRLVDKLVSFDSGEYLVDGITLIINQDSDGPFCHIIDPEKGFEYSYSKFDIALMEIVSKMRLM